jgi:hypothetical protein
MKGKKLKRKTKKIKKKEKKKNRKYKSTRRMTILMERIKKKKG